MTIFWEEPKKLKQKCSLKRLYLELRDKPKDQLEAIERELLHRQGESDLPKFSKALKRFLAETPEADERAVRVLRAALASEQLVAYVLRPNTSEAYKVGSTVWHMLGNLHDIAETITTGALHISDRLGKPNSADREVVNRPVYVEHEDAVEFLKPRGLSEPHIRKACERVISEIDRSNPRGAGRKRQFTDLLARDLPTFSARQIGEAWRRYTPLGWRKGGRPRNGSQVSTADAVQPKRRKRLR